MVFSRVSRPSSLVLITISILCMVILTGVLDYATSPELSISLFYLLAPAVATWFVGLWLGVLVSIVCIVVSLVGDSLSGFPHSNWYFPYWNALIVLGFYLTVVILLERLYRLTNGLQKTVSVRTADLVKAKTDRQRLERELLDISERERQRIGQDLHDSLSQHLTGVALSVKVLEEKLVHKELPESADVQRILRLVEEGIDISRTLARGLYPVEMTAEGLMEALDDLSRTTSDLLNVDCRFVCDAPVLLDDPTISGHLYRIAQEAVTNSVKHGKADRVRIELLQSEEGGRLQVIDNGSGISEKTRETGGMGLRIMAHRADVIGGHFEASSGVDEGTVVSCYGWPGDVEGEKE